MKLLDLIKEKTLIITDNSHKKRLLEDRNYYNTVRIYINGCMVGCAQADKWSFIEEGDNPTILPLTLNGNYNLSGILEELGNSEFKFIRLYDDRLTSTEIINNYIASIRNNDELKDKLLNKNLKISTAKMLIPQIHFVRNLKPILNPSKGDSKVERFEGTGQKTGLHDIKEKTNEDPVVVFEKALENIKPQLEVKSRRVGGSNYQVPVEVSATRSQTLGLRWLVNYARLRGGNGMALNLANEIIDASNGTGAAVKKREDTHRMAEANKAFAHYRW